MPTSMRMLTSMDLSGGQNSKTAPLFIKDNECELVQNYHLDNLGSLTKRNGIANLVGQIVNNKSILGMYFFKDIQGTDYSNVLVAINDASDTNSDIFDIETNAWVISKADDTASALPVFCSFIDYVFRTNGANAMGSSNNPPSAWATTNCLATLLPKYCCVWEDRVYALNDNSATKYPSRIYWSSLPSGTPLALTWTTASDYADINPDDNDEITWGEPFGRMLCIFKNRALYRWTFGQVEPDKIIDQGTPQGRTIGQVGGLMFWANIYGIWVWSGEGRPLLISKKVQDFIDVIPAANLTNMRGICDYDHYKLYIGDVTVSGISYSNVRLVYTISRKSWHFETFPFEIKSMARFDTKTLGTTSIYDAIYLGDDDGYIYRDGTGTSDYLGTTAKPINGKIITKEYPLINFPKTSTLEQVYFLAQKGTGAKVNYRIDRGDLKPWKDLTSRITQGKISGRARTIQFSITDNSITQSQIEGFSVEVAEERAQRREKDATRL